MVFATPARVFRLAKRVTADEQSDEVLRKSFQTPAALSEIRENHCEGSLAYSDEKKCSSKAPG